MIYVTVFSIVNVECVDEESFLLQVDPGAAGCQDHSGGVVGVVHCFVVIFVIS